MLLFYLQKLENRLLALEKVNWSESTKEEVRAVMLPEYTSSDQSQLSEDSSEDEPVVCRYLKKRLPWEQSRLTRAKSELDRVYLKSIKKRNRMARLPREPHTEVSSRPIPSEPQSWAVDTRTRRVPVTQRNYSSLDETLSSRSIPEPLATSTPLPRPRPIPTPRTRPVNYSQ